MSATKRKKKLENSTKDELEEYKLEIIKTLDEELERMKKLKFELKELSKELTNLINSKKNKKRALRRINSELGRRTSEKDIL